jgi:FixJ family two-component response regulator
MAYGREAVVNPPVVSIVDDDAAVRIATTRLVRSHGFVAHAFSSAEEFLASAHVGETSCLITDMRMPGMSGADLQRMLIAQGQCMPIIFVTAYREESRAANVKAAGAAGFLTKPFDGQALMNCLGEALKRANLVWPKIS